MISRSRGYLPHFETNESIYFVTFRLEDSLPSHVVQAWKKELEIKKNAIRNADSKPWLFEDEYEEKIQKYLDSGFGACWLKDPIIATLVLNALRYFDSQRYFLYAWTVMPNHVHVLFKTLSFTLPQILHSWKSFTANEANKQLSLFGRFWQPESFDTLIKSERQFEFCIRYILNNPVKAGLCKEFYQWPWSGCAGEIQYLVDRFFRAG
jgi:REP element-mobilizing transposase RayT